MSNSGKQSPLGVNVLGSLLNNEGLSINPVVIDLVGTSTDNNTYTAGTLITETCLNLLTNAINEAYLIGQPSGGSNIANATYANLITIGANVIPALGNSKPPSYEIEDPAGQWSGEATTGYAVSGNIGQGQEATWLPYDLTNPNFSITQWGWLRLVALQGYNDFDWNGIVDTLDPEYGNIQYKEFLSSFLDCQSYMTQSNQPIFTMQNSKTFLQGIYSNMNDLITGDVTGVSLSTQEFGKDLMNLGKALNLSSIATFGLPSNLLLTLQASNAITQAVSLALLSSGLTTSELNTLFNNPEAPITKEQQQKLYGAFLVVQNTDLLEVLEILECRTEELETLADLLNVKKCFPNSYKTLTVPLYTGKSGPTNTKTYYLIYADDAVNGQLDSSVVKSQIGTQIPVAQPADAPKDSVPALLREAINNLPDNVSLAEAVDAVATNQTAIQGGAVNNLESFLNRRYRQE